MGEALENSQNPCPKWGKKSYSKGLKGPRLFWLQFGVCALSLPFLGQTWSCFDLPFPRNLILVFHPSLPKNRKNKGYSLLYQQSLKGVLVKLTLPSTNKTIFSLINHFHLA